MFFSRKYVYRSLIFPNSFVLGRVACLGRDVFDLSFNSRKLHLINQQKTRVDLLLDYIEGRQIPNAEAVLPYLERTDIFSMIKQEEDLPWFNLIRKPRFIIMDSYAELTDQKFTHRSEGWSFSCNYTDLKTTGEFNSIFSSQGLLDLDLLKEYYLKFFAWIKKKYSDTPLIYIHFPTTLDNREKFRKRGAFILEVMKEICRNHAFIFNISVEDKMVFKNGEDDFPYHYGIKTNKAFAEKIPVRLIKK